MASTEQAAGALDNATALATNPADALNLNPTGFVDDLYNTVQSYCSQGFESLDCAVRRDLRWGTAQEPLTPEQVTHALQGTANLYQTLRTELITRLQTFEQYALAESLKVPAGLMAPAAAPPPGDAAGSEVDEETEAAVDASLAELRAQIAAAKQRGRECQAESSELQRLIDDLGAQLRQLRAVPAALAGKDSLLEDIQRIANRGMALEAGCARLDALRREKAVEHGDGAADAAGDGSSSMERSGEGAAERELLRRQLAVRAAAPEDLRRMRKRLGADDE